VTPDTRILMLELQVRMMQDTMATANRVIAGLEHQNRCLTEKLAAERELAYERELALSEVG
jgi:hypothetical protein